MQAISDCRQAIAEAESVDELSALARACYLLDMALVHLGRPNEATHSERALESTSNWATPSTSFRC